MKEFFVGAALLSCLALVPIGSTSHQVSASILADTSGNEMYVAYNEEYGEYVGEHPRTPATNQDVEYETEDEYEDDSPLIYRTRVRLNLRRGPGTGYNLVKTTNPGQLVHVTDTRDGEWFAVEVNGQTGFMYAYFLEKAPEATTEDLDVTTTLVNGTVERLAWSEARNVLTRGQAFTVVDVRTGITWQMASFSHGNHADSEPVTAADTAAMLRAWGGRWCWTPRPIHIHVNGRILAASVNGMPHAGSTIHNNNMRGHVCIHFYGSRTHNGNRSHERDHQNAVNEAFNAGA